MHVIHKTPKDHKTRRTAGSNLKQFNVAQGTHTILVDHISNAAWSKSELKVGDEIDASVETAGIKDGADISFSFYEMGTGGHPVCRDVKTQKVGGGKAKVTWKYPTTVAPKNNPAQHSDSLLYFVAKAASAQRSSQTIPLYSDLSIKVEKEDGSAISGVKAVVKLSNGVELDKTTDSSGKIECKKVPARVHRIVFPESPRVTPAEETISSFDMVPVERYILAFGSNVHTFKMIEIFIYCSHKVEGKRRCVANTNTFEVVPDSTGKDAYKDEVMILSRTATSLQTNGKSLEKKEDEFGMHAFQLKCDQDFKLVPAFWDIEFWKGLVKPNEYPVSGLPKSLTVKCYRPDLFKLQIKFPAFRKWSGGTKVESEASQFLNEVKNRRPKTASYWEYKKEKEGWHLNKWPKPLSSDAPVTFVRNGAEVKVAFLKAVGAVVALEDKLSVIISLIQKNVPKVGWYFEWENQLLQGTFVVEWGWKEYKDHRAYYYVGAMIDMKLIDLHMEIGVGISGFAYAIQIFGALSGGVTLSVKISRYSPDGEAEFSLPFGAEIIGSLGARAQAGCFVKLEGTVETGIKLEDGALKFNQNEGWSIGFAIKWSGITGKLKVSAGPAKKEGVDEDGQEQLDMHNAPKEMEENKSQTFEREIIGSSDLGKWHWPDANAEYSPPVIPREDLHKMMTKMLTEGDDIRVKTKTGLLGLNEYMKMENVAKAIEDRIHDRNDIRKDPKTAEALVFDIRKKLENLIYEKDSGLSFAHMEMDRFELFRKGGELSGILDKYIDPMQEIINKNP